MRLVTNGQVGYRLRQLQRCQLAADRKRKASGRRAFGLDGLDADAPGQVNRHRKSHTVLNIERGQQFVVSDIKLCQARVLIGARAVAELKALQFRSH